MGLTGLRWKQRNKNFGGGPRQRTSSKLGVFFPLRPSFQRKSPPLKNAHPTTRFKARSWGPATSSRSFLQGFPQFFSRLFPVVQQGCMIEQGHLQAFHCWKTYVDRAAIKMQRCFVKGTSLYHRNGVRIIECLSHYRKKLSFSFALKGMGTTPPQQCGLPNSDQGIWWYTIFMRRSGLKTGLFAANSYT